jgi:hypothetical protein
MSGNGIPGRAETTEEKEQVIQRLLEVWKAYPDLRLGQLILNALRDNNDILYMIEDIPLLEHIEDYTGY